LVISSNAQNAEAVSHSVGGGGGAGAEKIDGGGESRGAGHAPGHQAGNGAVIETEEERGAVSGEGTGRRHGKDAEGHGQAVMTEGVDEAGG